MHWSPGAQVELRGKRSRSPGAEASPAQFDVVTCMEMLEHVPDPAQSVRACAALARPGGWVFFSTINRNPKSFVLAIVGAEYVLNLLPRGTHEYAKFIKPSELTRTTHAAPDWTSARTGRHDLQPVHEDRFARHATPT